MSTQAGGLQVGSVLAGRFKVVGKIGKGAMGLVLKGEHVTSGQQVAIKVIAVDHDESEIVARFEQEARVLASLRSLNTVRLIDFGRADDGTVFMALELLVGRPLDEVIRDLTRQGATMTEAEACSVALQVLRSLAEAHGKGLVHRDLKPSNLFVVTEEESEPLIKVLDFGIARVANSGLTGAGQMLGTPTYMSPEQCNGANVDLRADLYSLGCLLYCCVTGQPPYSAAGPVHLLLAAHSTGRIPDPRSLAKHPLSDGFVEILRVAMAKQPADRYADAKAMRDAIQALVGGAWAGTPMKTGPSLANSAAAGPAAAAAAGPGSENDTTIARSLEDFDRTLVTTARPAPPARATTPELGAATRSKPVARYLAPAGDDEPVQKPEKSGSAIGVAVVAVALLVAGFWVMRGAKPVAGSASVAPTASVVPPAVTAPAAPAVPPAEAAPQVRAANPSSMVPAAGPGTKPATATSAQPEKKKLKPARTKRKSEGALGERL